MSVPEVKDTEIKYEPSYCPKCGAWLYENLTEVLGFCPECMQWFRIAKYEKDGTYVKLKEPIPTED